MVKNNIDSIQQFPLNTIDGQSVTLEEWSGDVLLIVNTASECGFTPQYEGLESLWTNYKNRGFTVLGFPSNDFGNQDPGKNEEILEFCQSRFGVTFPLFEKGSVKGEDAQPLFHYLTKEADQRMSGEIKWNFEKFLIGRDASLLNRFRSRIKPESNRLIRAIEDAL